MTGMLLKIKISDLSTGAKRFPLMCQVENLSEQLLKLASGDFLQDLPVFA